MEQDVRQMTLQNVKINVILVLYIMKLALYKVVFLGSNISVNVDTYTDSENFKTENLHEMKSILNLFPWKLLIYITSSFVAVCMTDLVLQIIYSSWLRGHQIFSGFYVSKHFFL